MWAFGAYASCFLAHGCKDCFTLLPFRRAQQQRTAPRHRIRGLGHYQAARNGTPAAPKVSPSGATPSQSSADKSPRCPLRGLSRMARTRREPCPTILKRHRRLAEVIEKTVQLNSAVD